MTKFSIVTLKVLAGVLLMANVFAFEEAKEDRIRPGSRALSHEELIKIEEACAQEQAEGDNEEALAKEEESSDESLVASPQAAAKNAAPQTTHAGAYHNPVYVSLFGDSVELEDGSIWNIKSGDAKKTLNWMTSDVIVVTQNTTPLSSYMFRLRNLNTGVTVKCNMSFGPIYNGLQTHWVIAINFKTKEVCLEDGSIWKVSGWDSSKFNTWLLNDTIIIGINAGYFKGSKPNLLINVNTLNWVRANCFY